MKTDQVSQIERETGRIGGDGGPSNKLTRTGRLPDGSLVRVNDRRGPGIGGKKGEYREEIENTHCLDRRVGTWRDKERGKDKEEPNAKLRARSSF